MFSLRVAPRFFTLKQPGILGLKHTELILKTFLPCSDLELEYDDLGVGLII
jgi:hypothetical protein